MRSRTALALALALLPASGTARERREQQHYADPSAAIAAELAFARLAQDKGQWSAFAATAAPDAVMFVPQMVYAQQWLKRQANPSVTLKWQPHSVSSSCDGSLMVGQGAWQSLNQTGYFTTIWQRQPDGHYKWILHHGDSLKEPLAAPEMISGQIADCPARGRRAAGAPPISKARTAAAKPKTLPPLDPAHRSGQSDDGTLRWEITVDPSGARNLSVDWKKDGADTPVLIEEVSAPEGK